MQTKSYYFLIVLLLIATVVTWVLYFRDFTGKDTANIFLFPKTIDTWTAEDLPISEDDYAILETKNAFVRKYSRPNGDAVYLFIVYSQNNRKVSHPPEICYTGSGVTLLGKGKETIALAEVAQPLDVNRLRLQKGNLDEIAFYWFKVGDAFTASYWKQQMLIVINTLMGKPTSSALIRLSGDIINENETQTRKLLYEFTQRIIPELHQYLP